MTVSLSLKTITLNKREYLSDTLIYHYLFLLLRKRSRSTNCRQSFFQFQIWMSNASSIPSELLGTNPKDLASKSSKVIQELLVMVLYQVLQRYLLVLFSNTAIECPP